LVLSLSIIAGSSGGQTLAQTSQSAEIRVAMDARDFDRAEQLVAQLKTASGSAYTAGSYDYLLARLFDRRGASQEARTVYESVIARGSALSGYSMWHLSVIARAQGDLKQERQYLTRLVSSGRSGALLSQANQRLIGNLMEAGEYRAAISRLQSGSTGRETLALLGDAYMASGNAAAARGIFSRLDSAGSHDDSALAASIGFDKLDREAGTKPDQFETIRRARIYLDNRHWAEAAEHFKRIADGFPNSPNRAEALYQIGYALFRQNNFDESIKWFDRAHAEFPGKKEGEHGYYWVGTALQKAGHFLEAAGRYEDFLRAYPGSDYLARAYLNIIDCYRYADRKADAIRWAKQAEQVFSGQPMAAVGLFDEAKIELSNGNYAAALTLLSRLQGAPSSAKQLGSPGRGEAEYLRAVALELMGQLQQAANFYLAIPDERDNYFGHRATLRLSGLAATDQGRRIIEPLERAYRDQARKAVAAGNYREAKDAANQALRLVHGDAQTKELLSILRTCYGNLPGYSTVLSYRSVDFSKIAGSDSGSARTGGTLIETLLSLGLYDEAADEMFGSGAGKSRPGHPVVTLGLSPFALAVLANRGSHADYAIAYAEPMLNRIPQDLQVALMPRDLAELFYPAPYRDSLVKFGGELGVDPRLVLSLARQESRFNPSVKSPASARGLLQLIPETAQAMANEAGLKGFRLEDAYEPEIALLLGTRYVSRLMKEFPGNPYAVAAGYNTDDDNVKRWIMRSRSTDPDRAVAEIALPETKDYVAKVMNNFWAYKQVYTRTLKPRD
ncbi:MAG: tetratricopeptide repeat protein, partial [Blastocatellia bacterium]